MTRNGKIARLPHSIRNQLNRRLQDGEPAKTLIPWLNTLPEVQTVVQAEFAGLPIRAQNISEWRKRGFREWQLQQDALEQVPLVAMEAKELNSKVDGQLTDHLAVWLTARLMAVARRFAAGDLTDVARWKLLHEVCADLVALRRGDQNKELMAIERERLMYLKDDLTCRYKKRIVMGLETFGKYVDSHPNAKVAWDALRDQLAGPLDNVEGAP